MSQLSSVTHSKSKPNEAFVSINIFFCLIHFPGLEGHSSLIYTKQLDGEKAGIAAPTRSTHLMHSFTGRVNTDDMEVFLLPSFTKAFTTQLRSYWLGTLDHPLNFVQLNKQLQLREV